MVMSTAHVVTLDFYGKLWFSCFASENRLQYLGMTAKEKEGSQGGGSVVRAEQAANLARAVVTAVSPGVAGKQTGELRQRTPIEQLKALLNGPGVSTGESRPHNKSKDSQARARLGDRPDLKAMSPQDATNMVDALVGSIQEVGPDNLDRDAMQKAMQVVGKLNAHHPGLNLDRRFLQAIPEGSGNVQGGSDASRTRSPLAKLLDRGAQNGDLFEGLDGAIAALPLELQGEARAIRSLAGSPEVTDGQLSGFHRDLSEMVERASEAGQRMTPDQRNAVYTLQDRLLKETYRRRESERVPSQIVISEDEVNAMRNHSLGAMDKWVTQQLDAYIDEPDGPKAKGMLHRIQLKLDYFLSDHFDFNQTAVIMERPENSALTPEAYRLKVQQSLKMLEVSREDYLKEYTTRSHLAQFHQMFKNAAEVGGERFMGLVNNMNERDWFAVDSMYGGVVGDAYQVLLRKYEAKIWKNGVKQGLEPNAWTEAMKETQDYLSANKELYEPKYIGYLQGKHLKGVIEDGSELFTKEHTESAIDKHIAFSFDEMSEHIVKLAAIRGDMWLDHSAVNIRGLSPLAHEIVNKGRSSYERKAPVESIKRLASFHTQIWGSDTGHPASDKAFWRHHAKLWVNATPDIEEWAGELTDGYWTRLQDVRGELGNAHGEYGHLSEKNKRLIDELRMVFMYSNEFEGGGAPKDEEMLEYAASARFWKNTLYEELLVSCGVEIAESHMLRPYFSWESTWRRGTVFDEMKSRLGGVFGGDNMKNLFTSKRLVDAASGYYKHKFEGDPRGKQEKFMSELYEIAAYRPHDLALALLEKDDKGLIQWFADQHIERGDMPTILTSESLQASVINRRLLLELKMPIDYARGVGGLSREQRDIVEKMFTSNNVLDEEKMAKHFTFLQGLAGALRGGGPTLDNVGIIKNFRSIRYEPLLTVPRFSDDLPLDLLEHPERADRASKEKPISEYVSGGGWDEQSGMMRRMWRDLSLAEKGKALMWQSKHNMKDEDLAKLQKELWDIIAPYQGENHAGMAVIQNLSAWLGMARVYRKNGRFFEGLANSSDFKKYSAGGMGPSMSADQLNHIVHVVENQAGKIHVNAPETKGVFKAMNAYLGISNWGGILSGDLHVNFKRKPANWFAYRQGDHETWLKSAFKKTGVEAFAHKIGFDKMVEGWISNMDESSPSGVVSFKSTMAPIYLLFLIAVFTATVAAKETKDQASSSGHPG